MKKLAVAGATAAAALGIAGPAAAAPKWGVKCEHIPSLTFFDGQKNVHPRSGIDCAHTMKAGAKWKMPKGVKVLYVDTTSGQELGAVYIRSGVAVINGPGGRGNWGTELWTSSHTNATPLSITARHTLVAVASSKAQTVRIAH